MYEVDHMLDGMGSRHLQNLINQAQYDRLARDMKAAQGKHPAVSSLGKGITTLISTCWRT
jgi:hypothetical protein